jgi:glycosyltransferase involved in cell wall biosynthesis
LTQAAPLAISAPQLVTPPRTFLRIPRMRVLLVCDSLNIGGAERHVIGLATGLRRRGHDVTIACSAPGDLDDEALDAGLGLHVLGETLVKRRVSVRYSRQLTDLIEAGGLDIVHAHMHASAAAAAIASARTTVPLVITEHTEAGWRDQRACRTSRTAYRRAAHVIAVSDRIARRLIEHDQLTWERVSAIQNALPHRPAVVEPRGQPLARIVRGEPLIGVVARLVPEKGVACFLRAAALTLRELPQTTFVIVGDGPLRQELSALAADLGIARRVRFLGARRDGPELIAELDVLAVPSLSEGTPLVTLEALSAGVALVASAVGGIPDQVRGFSRAVLVPPGDPAAMAQALVTMARATPARVRRATIDRISLLPGHDAMVRRTEETYAAAIAAARRRAAARERIAMQLCRVQ